MSGTVVFLGGATLPWLKVDEGVIVARGDDLRDATEPVTAIVPARGITYRKAAYSGLSAPQALAAARLDAAEVSLGTDRHVAVAEAGDHYVVTDQAMMEDWLAELSARNLGAVALIPAPCLLAAPESGFVRAEFPHEIVLRSRDTALDEDGTISALVVGDASVTTLGRDELERAIAEAVEYPPLNLLQGPFAPRADWGAAPGYWRRMAVLAGIVFALTLAIPLAQWVRLSMATAALDRQSAAIAAKTLGEATPSDDAVDRMQEKLVAQRGGGAGFLATQAAVSAAVEATPNVELSSLSFDPDGTLHALVRATGVAEVDAMHRAVEKRGFEVTEGAPSTTQGRTEVQFQVRPR